MTQILKIRFFGLSESNDCGKKGIYLIPFLEKKIDTKVDWSDVEFMKLQFKWIVDEVVLNTKCDESLSCLSANYLWAAEKIFSLVLHMYVLLN